MWRMFTFNKNKKYGVKNMVIHKSIKLLGVISTLFFLSGCATSSQNSYNGKIVMSQESQINSIIKV